MYSSGAASTRLTMAHLTVRNGRVLAPASDPGAFGGGIEVQNAAVTLDNVILLLNNSQVVDDELPYFIDELNGPRRMEVVGDGLAKRGLPARDVDRVMGGNLLRLYRDVIG